MNAGGFIAEIRRYVKNISDGVPLARPVRPTKHLRYALYPELQFCATTRGRRVYALTMRLPILRWSDPLPRQRGLPM